MTGIFVLGFPLLLRKMYTRISPATVKLISRILIITYLLGIMLITLGLREYGSETIVNLRLFESYRKMFAPVVNGFHNSGLKGAIERFKWVDYASRSNVILNILLFLPLGYLLPFSKNKLDKWYFVLLIGVGVSAAIEVTQLLTHRGWFDVDDVFHNGLGALIGWFCYKHWLRDVTDERIHKV